MSYDYHYRGHRLDPYRVCDIYGITHGAHHHAVKKLLRAGHGDKTLRQDVEEAIQCLERWLEMMDEDFAQSSQPDPRENV